MISRYHLTPSGSILITRMSIGWVSTEPLEWISEGRRRVKEIRRSDYTVLGTLEYGPIRAQDPRFPWQGLVWRSQGVGLAGGRARGETGERRGGTRRGAVPAVLATTPKPAGLVGPGGSWEQAGVARRVSAEAGRAHFHGSLTACPVDAAPFVGTALSEQFVAL